MLVALNPIDAKGVLSPDRIYICKLDEACMFLSNSQISISTDKTSKREVLMFVGGNGVSSNLKHQVMITK